MVNDATPPVASAPATKTFEGCDTGAITPLVYSTTPVTITSAQLTTEGGSASDTCSDVSISYQDSKSGSCPIVVTRTFTVKDACLNTTTKTQTINVADTTPPLASAPATKTFEGCDTGAIAPLVYSTTPVTITSAQLTTEGGSASDTCSDVSISYQDSKSGSCPIVVTRTFTVKDACLNTTTKTQTINVADTTPPLASAPATKTFEGCDTGAIAPLVYSTTPVTITSAQLTTEGGSASDTCSAVSISYQDSKSGSCPIVVTRTFTVKDACLNTTTKTQTINVADTTPPLASAPATKTFEGCDTGAITPLVYSTTPVTITSAQLTTEGGSASDTCSAVSISYQDSKSGSCPIVVTRTFTVK